MTNTPDVVRDPPQPARQIDDVAAEHNEISEAEKGKNSLQSELMREKICRDVQRKEHRGIVFAGITLVCFVFYLIFVSLVPHVYSDLDVLKNVPVLWVIPLLALVTVPTVLLVMMVLALYRKDTGETPNGVLRILESLSRMTK